MFTAKYLVICDIILRNVREAVLAVLNSRSIIGNRTLQTINGNQSDAYGRGVNTSIAYFLFSRRISLTLDKKFRK